MTAATSLLAEVDWSLGDGLVTILWIFMFVIWFWLLITIFSDLFRDHELSGGVKALWVIFVVVIPWLGILVYLIARGGGMAKRAAAEQQEAQKQFSEYVQAQTGGTDPATQIEKAKSLLESGAITQEEFDSIKGKALS